MKRKDIIHIGVRAAGSRNANPLKTPPWYLSISESARREMQLPYHKRLRVRMSPHGTPVILPVVATWHTAVAQQDTLLPVRVAKNKQGIVLGPIIGILTVKKPGADGFRGNRANFRDLARMGKRLGLAVVVFTPEGISAKSDTMEGWVYQGASAKVKTSKAHAAWRKVVLPLPSVVYNRVPDREAESSPEVMQVKKWLNERGIPLFNQGFFNKQELAGWLQGHAETASCLPRTETLSDPRQLQRFLRHHDLLYVKPADGKAGDGIIQVRREGNRWRVTHQQGGKRARAVYNDRQEAADAVWKKTRGRAYLLQQGIYLAASEGRSFDLRLLIQKNRFGEWGVTGIGARIADRDGITTHVPNGGKIEQAAKVLRAAFGDERAEEIDKQVRSMAAVIAETIEREVTSTKGGTLGEMSMDIGVASDGTLWFFEANAKPMKFDEPYIRARSLLRLLHFCEYLAKTSS